MSPSQSQPTWKFVFEANMPKYRFKSHWVIS